MQGGLLLQKRSCSHGKIILLLLNSSCPVAEKVHFAGNSLVSLLSQWC